METSKSGIKALFASTSTVFTVRELALIWHISNQGYLKSRINYYIKKGYIYRLKYGMYAKDKSNFNLLEVANKLRVPSYISLETVLAKEGIIFQQDTAIYAVSCYTRNIQTSFGIFRYKKIKDTILYNSNGIVDMKTYYVATKERAFLDAVYLYKNYHFDNLRSIDWKKAEALSLIYKSRSLEQRVKEYKKDAQSREA